MLVSMGPTRYNLPRFCNKIGLTFGDVAFVSSTLAVLDRWCVSSVYIPLKNAKARLVWDFVNEKAMSFYVSLPDSDVDTAVILDDTLVRHA